MVSWLQSDGQPASLSIIPWATKEGKKYHTQRQNNYTDYTAFVDPYVS